MFGLWDSYDNEFIELYEHLTQSWEMRPEFAREFLSAYKRDIGKIFSGGRARMSAARDGTDPGLNLIAMANAGEEEDFALVAQAYKAYMSDLRRGKHVGGPVEKVIWAILYNRCDLVSSIDRGFADWIEKTIDGRFPGLFEEVFR